MPDAGDAAGRAARRTPCIGADAAGRGLTVGFTPDTPGDPLVGIAAAEDGVFVDGCWVAGRRLNGDEILSGKGLRLRGDYYMVQRVKLYRYR